MAGFITVGAIVLVTLFILFVFWALNSRTAGERGWVYNRYNLRKRGGGTLGLEAMFQPSIAPRWMDRCGRRTPPRTGWASKIKRTA